MKIFFNGRFLSRPMTGVDRFAAETLKALDLQLGGVSGKDGAVPWQCELLIPPNCPRPSYQNIKVREVPGPSGQLWEQWALWRASRGGVLVNLCNTAPLLKRRQVVVIHDATTKRVPKTFSWAFRQWYAVLMPILGKFSMGVATISEFSKRDIADAFGIPLQRITVLPEGAEHIQRFTADLGILEKAQLTQRPFFLAVSSVVPHKNFDLILQALERATRLDFDVAIAGGSNPKVFGDGGMAQHPNIKWLGYVSNEELKALYEHASGFVFPSFYEGFGLPPIEAMACACPVIASNAASMPEVCGDAALFIEPNDPAGLLAAMQQLLDSPELACRLREAGARRVRHWTWARAASDLWNLILKVGRSR